MFGTNHHLINFKLKPLRDIRPWESGLHWFGLTDGWYWIAAGSTELYRLSPEILAHWRSDGYTTSEPYVDYQIVRLYEDLLEVVPYAFEPIPAEMFRRFKDPVAMLDRMRSLIADLPEETFDLLDRASAWLGYRTLTSSHLTTSPHIRFLRVDNEMTMDWVISGKPIDGIRVHEAKDGTFLLPFCKVST